MDTKGRTKKSKCTKRKTIPEYSIKFSQIWNYHVTLSDFVSAKIYHGHDEQQKKDPFRNNRIDLFPIQRNPYYVLFQHQKALPCVQDTLQGRTYALLAVCK